MKKIFFLTLLFSALCQAELYIALTNFPAQSPAIDTLRYVLADFKEDAFYFDADLEKVNVSAVYGKEKEVEEVAGRYSLWLHEEPSDLVFIVPGLGTHYRNSQAALLGEAFYNAGFSVAIVSNPFCWEFIDHSLTSLAPGYTRSDAKDLYRYLAIVRDDIEKNEPGQVKDHYIVGYSLGALQAAFLAENDAIEQRLNFKRYLLLSPPVNLIYGLTTLDRYYEAWRKWDTSTILTNRNKAVAFYRGYTAELLKSDSYINATEDEASFVIGYSFRQTLMAVMEKVVKRHELEIFGEFSDWKQQAFEKQFERYTYQRYVDTFLRLAHPNAFVTAEPFRNLNNECSLPAVSKTLQQNKNIVMLHAVDDFLETEYDRNWLRRTMGDRLVMLDHGSHLGYFCMPQALDIMVKLLKGEPVTGPKASGQPRYDHFAKFLAEQKAKEQAQGQTSTKTSTSTSATPAATATTPSTKTTAPAAQPVTTTPAATSTGVSSFSDKPGVKSGATPSQPPTKPQAVTVKNGRRVEWRLMPDDSRQGDKVYTMQEVDVETGLTVKAYEESLKNKAAEEQTIKTEEIKPTEKPEDKAVEKTVEVIEGKSAEKPEDKAVKKTVEVIEGKSAEKPEDKAVKKTVEVIEGKSAEEPKKVKTESKAIEKSAEKAVNKSSKRVVIEKDKPVYRKPRKQDGLY